MQIHNFPNTYQEAFSITSPATNLYNCIAWAYGISDKWVWPSPNSYWPSNVPQETSIQAFIQLFESIGYTICPDGVYEVGFEKVAIYVDANNKPTHAARQQINGVWTSKLGMSVDVDHSIFSMENGAYGNVSVYLRRKL